MPQEVIDAFNELIAESWDGRQAHFTMKVAARRVELKLAGAGMPNVNVYEKGWLDVEPIYRKAGWVVAFDNPGYNESYEANYIFKKKVTRG